MYFNFADEENMELLANSNWLYSMVLVISIQINFLALLFICFGFLSFGQPWMWEGMPQLSFAPSEYKNAFDRVRSYVLSHCGNIDDVHDVLQQGILELLEKTDDQLKDVYLSIDVYLIGICKNLWLKELSNRLPNEIIVSLEEIPDDNRIELIIMNRKELLVKILRRNIKNLSQNCQKIVEYKEEGLTCREIAKKMDRINNPSFRNKVSLCKNRLMTLVKMDEDYKRAFMDE